MKSQSFPDANYYPSSYIHSREIFNLHVSSHGANVEKGQWLIPSEVDPDLTVDYGYWPALKIPELLVVVTSGIHGSETYAGAAIQSMVMREILTSMDRSKIGFVMVHSMNPYGFKYHQRTTENGVNLNRNFSLSGKLFKTENKESARLHERFFERKPVSSLQSRLLSALQIKNGSAFFEEVSLDQFTKAVSPGQFLRPEDLEFGGHRMEPQSQFLAKKIQELMPLYKDIVALDLHTGLGDPNRLHLLTSGSGLDLHPELFAKLFDVKKDHEFYVHTPATEEGFYEVHGALNNLFVEVSRPDQRVCAITMEFGTLGHSLEAQLAGLNSFIVDHQGHYYGFESVELERESKKENFLRSYPQSDEWKTAVIQASRGLFERMLTRAGAL